ncbi:NAD(P)/FAD-dependent oxidoreductase [Spongorhabdus nitratireducens]
MQDKTVSEEQNRPHHIIVVGGGAGGLELVTRLGRKMKHHRNKCRVTLVDANMTHIWKPLLHEVASGALNSFDDELSYMAQARWNNFSFVPGRLAGINRDTKTIQIEPSQDKKGNPIGTARDLAYDTLVISIGSKTNDFGTKGAAEHCQFLDSREQAEQFHARLLSRYFRAQSESAEQQKLRIAIIGAGATGVELAAELRHASEELTEWGLDAITADNVEINLIEGANRVLPVLSERISNGVQQELQKMNIRLHLNTLVSQVTAEGLETHGGEVIEADLKVWAAGIRAPSFLAGFGGLETNRLNQLLVKPTLQTTMDDNIYAFGDCASCTIKDKKGNDFTVPPRAQAAHQQASLLTKSLANLVLKGKEPKAYCYRDYGSLVSLSNRSAVGNLMGSLTGNINIEGKLARMFYISLYRMHQLTLYGKRRTAFLLLRDLLERSTQPRLKLH